MPSPRSAVVAAAVGTVLACGGTYAVIQVIDTEPRPQVVIPPTPAQGDDHGRN
jgi:hypothetical protein